MSIVRQIRTLYTISSNTFLFIVWQVAVSMLIGVEPSSRLYLISLLTAFLLQFLINKLSKIKLAVLIVLIISEALIFIFCKETYFIYNSIFNLIIIITVKINEEEEINYESLKYRARQSFIVLVIVGLFNTISDLTSGSGVFKFYIIFLISLIIALREARNYSYGIRNKKSKVNNIILAIAILVTSMDFVFIKFIEAVKFLYQYIDLFLKLVIKLIVVLMRVPLELAIKFLSKRQEMNPGLFEKVAGKQQQEAYENIIDKTSNLPPWLNTLLEVMVLLTLVYIVYKIILNYQTRKQNKSKVILEEREKIVTSRQKESFIKRTIKKLLKTHSIREQIFNIYKKFQLQTAGKGIFKEHMTAKQLENVTKAYVQNPEGINVLTDLYNEAKFSEHKVMRENLELIKDSYNKVKKQL